MIVYVGLVEKLGDEFTMYKQSSRPQRGGHTTTFEIAGFGILRGAFSTTSDVRNDDQPDKQEFLFNACVTVKVGDTLIVCH